MADGMCAEFSHPAGMNVEPGAEFSHPAIQSDVWATPPYIRAMGLNENEAVRRIFAQIASAGISGPKFKVLADNDAWEFIARACGQMDVESCWSKSAIEEFVGHWEKVGDPLAKLTVDQLKKIGHFADNVQGPDLMRFGDHPDVAALLNNAYSTGTLPNVHIRSLGSGNPGVGLTLDGCPDFAGTPYLHPTLNTTIEIRPTGKRGFDELLSNRGHFPSTPTGYTWHHVSFDSSTGMMKMQLVKTVDHAKAIPHIGGFKEHEIFVRLMKQFGYDYSK